MRESAEQAKRTQDFGENENEDHADEQTRLLGRSAHASVPDDADGEAGSQTGKTDGQSGAQLDEARVQRKLLLQAVRDEDRHYEAVDADDTGHDNRYNVCMSMKSTRLVASSFL